MLSWNFEDLSLLRERGPCLRLFPAFKAPNWSLKASSWVLNRENRPLTGHANFLFRRNVSGDSRDNSFKIFGHKANNGRQDISALQASPKAFLRTRLAQTY